MILHNFTHKCTTLIRTSLTKFADRFFRKRSTSFSVGPPQTVCTSLVCALSVLYIVLFLLAAAETSLLPPSQNAMCLSCHCTHAHLTAICDWTKRKTKPKFQLGRFPRKARVVTGIAKTLTLLFILIYLNADDTMRLEGFTLPLWPEIIRCRKQATGDVNPKMFLLVVSYSITDRFCQGPIKANLTFVFLELKFGIPLKRH